MTEFEIACIAIDYAKYMNGSDTLPGHTLVYEETIDFLKWVNDNYKVEIFPK